MFIKIIGWMIVVVGVGEQVVQKCCLLLKLDVDILLFGDQLDDELSVMIKQGCIWYLVGFVMCVFFVEVMIGFIVIGLFVVDVVIYVIVKDVGFLVNVVDCLEFCDLIMLLIVDCDLVVVVIGIEGNVFVLGCCIKIQIEQMLDLNFGCFVVVVGCLCGMVVCYVL